MPGAASVLHLISAPPVAPSSQPACEMVIIRDGGRETDRRRGGSGREDGQAADARVPLQSHPNPRSFRPCARRRHSAETLFPLTFWGSASPTSLAGSPRRGSVPPAKLYCVGDLFHFNDKVPLLPRSPAVCDFTTMARKQQNSTQRAPSDPPYDKSLLPAAVQNNSAYRT